MIATKASHIALTRFACVLVLAGILATALASGSEPEAVSRSNADNFKDMVLARCLARAYQAEPTASADARSSANVLLEWARYDAERGTEAIPALIEKYLARDYSNPLVEYRDRRFSFLKCMDLYRSEELKSMVAQLVSP